MTWIRDSHGLFDYEWCKVIKAQYVVKGCVFIKRMDDLWCVWEPQVSELLEDEAIIATIAFVHNTYWLYHSWSMPNNEIDNKNWDNLAWIIVK